MEARSCRYKFILYGLLLIASGPHGSYPASSTSSACTSPSSVTHTSPPPLTVVRQTGPPPVSCSLLSQPSSTIRRAMAGAYSCCIYRHGLTFSAAALNGRRLTLRVRAPSCPMPASARSLFPSPATTPTVSFPTADGKQRARNLGVRWHYLSNP